MKKIISLLLSLTLMLGCMLVLGSCAGPTDPAITVADICEMVENAPATKTVTLIDYVKANGDTVNDVYTMTVDGNDSIFEYARTRMITPEEAIELGVSGRYITDKNYIYFKDGLYSTDGANWGSAAPSASTIKFDLKEEYLTNATLSESGTDIVAQISSENIKNVFGVELDIDGTFTIEIETDGTNLAKVNVHGKTSSGANLNISTSYTYSKQTLEFPTTEN